MPKALSSLKSCVSKNVSGSEAHFRNVSVCAGAGEVLHLIKSLSSRLSMMGVWRLGKMKTITACRRYQTGRGRKEQLNNEQAKGTRGRNLRCKPSVQARL